MKQLIRFMLLGLAPLPWFLRPSWHMAKATLAQTS